MKRALLIIVIVSVFGLGVATCCHCVCGDVSSRVIVQSVDAPIPSVIVPCCGSIGDNVIPYSDGSGALKFNERDFYFPQYHAVPDGGWSTVTSWSTNITLTDYCGTILGGCNDAGVSVYIRHTTLTNTDYKTTN
jgi:hypothetical protein